MIGVNPSFLDPTQPKLSARDIANIEYNKNILNSISDEYKEFEPFFRIIVRCMLVESKVVNGIYKPAKVEVPVRTANEMAFKEYQDSPYLYSTNAVVVAVPEGFTKYKVGDWVVVDRNAVLATKQNVQDHRFHLAHGFTMPSYTDSFEPPHDSSSPHYGYLILDASRQTHGINKNFSHEEYLKSKSKSKIVTDEN